MGIAQTQTQQARRPTITALTIQCACQNSVNSERSDEVSGSTDCATSAGFMGTSFPLSGSVGQTGAADNDCSNWERPATPYTRATEIRGSGEIPSRPATRRRYEIPRNLAVLGRVTHFSAFNSAD